MDNKVLTIDPGVYTMGACLWDEQPFKSKDIVCLPIKRIAKEIKDRAAYGAIGSMKHLIDWLYPWFDEFVITDCYCEKPQVFNSARGYASNVQGHVQQMEMFRGMLYQTCQDFAVKFHDVKVTDWKGQLPKKLVNERITKIYAKYRNRGNGIAKLTGRGSHDWDAAGIGFFLQGIF